MNCKPCTPPVFEIYLGDNKTMNLSAAYLPPGGPLDLTSCTEIVVLLPKADGTFLSYTLTGSKVTIQSPAVLGLFNIAIPSVDSALLNVGELQTFTVTFTISGETFTVPYVESLSVLEL